MSSNKPTNLLPEDTRTVYKNIPKISLKDVVEFIRSHHELSGWSDEEIEFEVALASRHAALAFTTDDKGKLSGICFGEWQEKGTVFFCHCMIAPEMLPTYVRYLKRTFPQCKKIRGIRGESVQAEYDTDNLFNLQKSKLEITEIK